MFEEQEIVTIEKSELIRRVEAIQSDGYRLVQVSCTKTDHFCIDYTFDKEYHFYGLRIILPLEQPTLPSISGIYFAAFLYENEIHDLFGVSVSDMKLDFKGKFYRIAEKNPFSASDIEVVVKND